MTNTSHAKQIFEMTNNAGRHYYNNCKSTTSRQQIIRNHTNYQSSLSNNCIKLQTQQQKLLTMTHQRYLPVRQFDTIANANSHLFLYNVSRYTANHYGYNNTRKLANKSKNVIGLLPPPSVYGSNIRKILLNQFSWMKRVASFVNNKFETRPLFYGAIFATIKSVFADLFAQTIVEGKSMDDINWRRNILFAALGLFWTGYVHYFVYYWLYPQLFSGIRHFHWFWRSTIQSAFDQTFHSALIYYPFFYCFKTCVYDGFSLNSCQKGVSTYLYVNFKSDIKALCCVWVPANLITFGIVPPHLRVPWLTCVSFGWIVLLSLLRGEQEENQSDETPIVSPIVSSVSEEIDNVAVLKQQV